MSTQTKFDLIGLSRAVEAHDFQYQLALYADNAEVQILDADDPTERPRVLVGKPAIRTWLEGMASDQVVQRLADPSLSQDRLAFVEECRNQDGTVVTYTCAADLRRGQIARQFVKADHPSSARTSDRASRHTTVMIDHDPPACPHAAPHRATAPEWSPPGNFLG